MILLTLTALDAAYPVLSVKVPMIPAQLPIVRPVAGAVNTIAPLRMVRPEHMSDHPRDGDKFDYLEESQ